MHVNGLCNLVTVGFNIVKISNCLWSLSIKLIPHCSPRKNNIDYRIGKIYFIIRQMVRRLIKRSKTS